MNKIAMIAAACVTLCGYSLEALPFKLSPKGTALEQSVAKKYENWWRRVVAALNRQGVNQFTQPVHEEITNRAFGCEGDADVCGNPDVGFASPYVLAGVRWNDDPPFRLAKGQARATTCKVAETIRYTTQPTCWAVLFWDAKRKAQRGITLDATGPTSLLGRSHFGDLQFLHAMARRDGELASETRRQVLMWAEFTWGVVSGTYGLNTKLKQITIEGFGEHFGRTGWTVQDLFTLGNPSLRRKVRSVAFGSLLHMVEDSFAKGHVDRAEPQRGKNCTTAPQYAAPGVVRSFHAYNNQDSGKHGQYDSRSAFSAEWTVDEPDVVDVTRNMVALRERSAPWPDVKAYLECVFELENPAEPASAGAAFVMN
jgi:hypothetical protein